MTPKDAVEAVIMSDALDAPAVPSEYTDELEDEIDIPFFGTGESDGDTDAQTAEDDAGAMGRGGEGREPGSESTPDAPRGSAPEAAGRP